MTSQHFDDGWGNWGEDWGANFNENNNNSNTHQNPQQVSQPNTQFVQQPPQLTSNAPVYSPFLYQQPPQQSTAAMNNVTLPNPFAKPANQPPPQQSNINQMQQQYGNPVNFFNPTQFSDANSINNNMAQQYASNQPSTYSYVQSPIPTSSMTSTTVPQNQPSFDKVNNFQYQDVRHATNVTQNPVQYSVQPPLLPSSNLPPTASFSNDQKTALPTSILPTQQTMYQNSNNNNNNVQQNVNQPRNVATPPTLMQNFDKNFNSTMPPHQTPYQQYSQWDDPRSQSIESDNNALNTTPNWQQQTIPANQTVYNNVPTMPVSSSNNLEWQNLQAQPAAVSLDNQSTPPTSSAAFFNPRFDTPIKEESINQIQEHMSSIPSTSNQVYQQSYSQPKFENIENIQNSIKDPIMSVPQMPPQAPSPFNTAPPPKHDAYPENRERLDDLIPPPSPILQTSSISTTTSSAPSIDRHNYLVTGQLSQEFPAFINSNQQQPHESVIQESFNENQIPPGLSRMVVGEPENNQEQIQQQAHSEVLPPRSNRMVTGNEMTPASFMNYQRQADGEVSQEPTIQPRALPAFNNANNLLPIQREDEQQQSFNISDRNLYLVAGESEAINSQRVITGVESDHNINPMNIIMNPLQNLHIEDDEDFVNVSVTQRNIDGDGMEEAIIQQQQIQRALDSSQQREEEIEGANDNNVELSNVSAPQVLNLIEIPPVPATLNEHSSQNDIREDIEGGNDSSDPPKPKPVEFEEKRKSIDSGMRSQQKLNMTLSSEDSELRELEKNMKKSRRSKKYDSNDSESNSLDEYKKKPRDRYDDRHNKKNRDRIRDELEKYKKKERERRSGGRQRVNDDTDGSRYGDSKRRTDEEVEDRRRHRNRNRNRGNDDKNDVSDHESVKKDGKTRDQRDRKEYDEYDDRKKSDKRRAKKYYDDERYESRRPTASDHREYERHRTKGSNSRGAYDMPGYYHQQPGYPYDSNYYYHQQQQLNNWLEQVRLTNPQAYEWYKSYYAGMLQNPQMPAQPAMDDIGGSLRSGYNSSSERASTSRFGIGGIVTNPLRSLNTSFVDNTNEYQSLQHQALGKDFNQAYSSFNNYNNYNLYGDSRAKTSEVTASRMTPQKFQCLHGFIRLTNGLMITVDTYNTDEKYSVKIENVPIHDKTRRLYQSFPGPLIRGVSHKKTVIEFCEEKLKLNYQQEASLRSSYALLWSYLILMIRQNGSYTEQDIAELLMKNSEEYRAYDADDNKSSSNNNNTNEVDDENATDVSESEENAISEHNSASHSNQVTQSTTGSVSTEQVVLDKFKSYLLYGNIHDALDYATDNNLWGHALFLASKVDRRQHANVMLKFANKLSYNDPLQTLYQIMSGRMPACATNFDDKWGDWRPHLSMIISNCTDKPDLVKRTILALGDTLASRGDIFGSQFCYLLIDPQFTDYSDTTMLNGKISLLGTSIQKPFNEFATNDSIIMTEVYEYARSLNTENYFIASLQNYKFLLATNMLDYGLKLKCLLYMEQISKCIIQQPQLFESSFISKIYSLADRLKFYDPVMEKLYEDNTNNVEGTEDQKWLQDIALVLQNQVGSSELHASPVSAPQNSSNDVYNSVEYQQQQSQQTPIYDPASQQQTPVHVPTMPIAQTYEEHDSNQYSNFDQQSQVPAPSYDQSSAYNPQYQMPEQQQMQNYQYGQNMPPQNNDVQNIPQNNEPQQNQQQAYFQPTFDPNTQYQQNDYGGYGWDQPKPNITMGASVSHKFDENQSREKSETDAGGHKEDKKSPAKKAEQEKSKKQPQPGNNSGWFSSLFRIGKAPNQMILPDDKNPSILWDEATKKWVNKDEDAAETESFKPPPKMGEMGGVPMSMPMQNIPQQTQHMQNIPQSQPIPQQSIPQTQQFIPQNQQPIMQQQPMVTMQNHVAPMSQQQSSQQVSQNPIEEASVPSAPNMFKMQKGRNLKKSYVDILGNAGKTVSQPKELAPQMDMQFFNPAAQPQGMQFYNPNDFQ